MDGFDLSTEFASEGEGKLGEGGDFVCAINTFQCSSFKVELTQQHKLISNKIVITNRIHVIWNNAFIQ